MYIGWYKLSWLYEYNQLMLIALIYFTYFSIKTYNLIFWEGLFGGRSYFKRFSKINRRYLSS